MAITIIKISIVVLLLLSSFLDVDAHAEAPLTPSPAPLSSPIPISPSTAPLSSPFPITPSTALLSTPFPLTPSPAPLPSPFPLTLSPAPAPMSDSSPMSQVSCEEELVLFSPCLPYVSAPPNNATATAGPQCCAVFSSAVDSGVGNCLCYLIRRPMILGFPLDQARLLSLPQICTDTHRNGSLDSLCESPDLPPLQKIPETTTSSNSGEQVVASSLSLPPESSNSSSPNPFRFPLESPRSTSSAATRIFMTSYDSDFNTIILVMILIFVWTR